MVAPGRFPHQLEFCGPQLDTQHQQFTDHPFSPRKGLRGILEVWPTDSPSVGWLGCFLGQICQRRSLGNILEVLKRGTMSSSRKKPCAFSGVLWNSLPFLVTLHISSQHLKGGGERERRREGEREGERERERDKRPALYLALKGHPFSCSGGFASSHYWKLLVHLWTVSLTVWPTYPPNTICNFIILINSNP